MISKVFRKKNEKFLHQHFKEEQMKNMEEGKYLFKLIGEQKKGKNEIKERIREEEEEEKTFHESNCPDH